MAGQMVGGARLYRTCHCLGVERRKMSAVEPGLTVMIAPLWSVESRQKPGAAWYQGCFGELCHSEESTFNILAEEAASRICRASTS